MWFESPVLISAGFFWLIAAVTKILADNATKRRLLEARVSEDVVRALFRKGYDPELFSALKWGMVLAALGMGVMLVPLLSLEAFGPLAIGLMMICAGGGMLGYYLVATAVMRHDPRGRSEAELRAPRHPDDERSG